MSFGTWTLKRREQLWLLYIVTIVLYYNVAALCEFLAGGVLLYEGKPDGFASDLTVGEDGMALAG